MGQMNEMHPRVPPQLQVRRYAHVRSAEPPTAAGELLCGCTRL